eukprot:TRINITY_DN19757_c0_g1_i1.p1 TRINITY_DN19757_c0_g1~~TRINITY_DN19757_c0_g1_i1.p1  ORF type:complete len:123 (+),score=17.72 TRINITY_DN19757_c0_g1_i1:48-416(+)
MPTLKIETNIKEADIKDMAGALKELSKAMAETTGKPETYVGVQIIPNQNMIFGGSDAPCGQAAFMCIGKMGVEENKKHAGALYPVIEKQLGIPSDRMYISFTDAPTSELGFKGTTFHAILGR